MGEKGGLPSRAFRVEGASANPPCLARIPAPRRPERQTGHKRPKIDSLELKFGYFWVFLGLRGWGSLAPGRSRAFVGGISTRATSQHGSQSNLHEDSYPLIISHFTLDFVTVFTLLKTHAFSLHGLGPPVHPRNCAARKRKDTPQRCPFTRETRRKRGLKHFYPVVPSASL